MVVRAVTVVVREDKTVRIFWEGLLNGDTGEPVKLARYPDKTVQIVGNFGGSADVDMDGSPDKSTWGQLSDPQGTLISIQDSLPLVIAESPEWIRPDVTTGNGDTDLDVTIIAVARGA